MTTVRGELLSLDPAKAQLASFAEPGESILSDPNEQVTKAALEQAIGGAPVRVSLPD